MLLRNWTEALPGGLLISGTSLAGLPGSQILADTATGTFGPGAMFNDDLNPAKQYFMRLADPNTFPGTVFEDGSLDATATVFTTYTLYEDNLVAPAGLDIPLDVMIGPVAEMAAVEVGPDLASMTGTVTPDIDVTAVVAAVESGPDVAAILGTVVPVLFVTGTVNAVEPGTDIASATGTVFVFVVGSMAAAESGPDTTSFTGMVTPLVLINGAVAAFEAGQDLASAVGTVTYLVKVDAAVNVAEDGSDAMQAFGEVFRGYTGQVAIQEVGQDLASAQGAIFPAIIMVAGDVEDGVDLFDASGFIIQASSTAGSGMLAALAAEYAAMRAASGLFVGQSEVLSCAIAAARFYAGWAVMTDASARPGPFYVTGSTSVTMDEWAIIAPLFRLYVERESAVVVEASRGLGIEQVGRSYAEVASDISQMELTLPQLAFQEDAFSIGLPAE